MSFSIRQKAARLYWKRLLSRLPNRRMPVVVEQETAEIGLERLDADADRIEIVAIRDVADVIVDEGFLQTDEIVVALGAFQRLDEEHAPLGHGDVAVVEGHGDAVFDLGRLERGLALDQRSAGDEALREDEARVLAEHVETLRARSGLYADRDREGPWLEHRVADEAEVDEPVVALEESRPTFAQRDIALEHVLVIGVGLRVADLAHGVELREQRLVGAFPGAQAGQDAPAIGHR